MMMIHMKNKKEKKRIPENSKFPKKVFSDGENHSLNDDDDDVVFQKLITSHKRSSRENSSALVTFLFENSNELSDRLRAKTQQKQQENIANRLDDEVFARLITN